MRNLKIFVWVTAIILIMTDTGNAGANKNIYSAHEHTLYFNDKLTFGRKRWGFFNCQCEQ